jgi:hypothetical protein
LLQESQVIVNCFLGLCASAQTQEEGRFSGRLGDVPAGARAQGVNAGEKVFCLLDLDES